jgi:hypothetical protein
MFYFYTIVFIVCRKQYIIVYFCVCVYVCISVDCLCFVLRPEHP